MLAVAAVALFTIVGSARADIIPLGDLLAGGSFQSDNGQLLFSDFEADFTGDMPDTVDDYFVITRDSGFRIVGPFTDSELGMMDLNYTVAAPANIADAYLGVSYNLAQAGLWVQETFSDIETEEDLLDVEGKLAVLLAGAVDDSLGFDDLEDLVGFLEGSDLMRVNKKIMVVPDGVDQDFFIPEPATAVLALGGVALLRRRVSHRAA
jgi:hypothetical protein